MVFQLHDFVHFEVTLFAIVSFFVEITRAKKKLVTAYLVRGDVMLDDSAQEEKEEELCSKLQLFSTSPGSRSPGVC